MLPFVLQLYYPLVAGKGRFKRKTQTSEYATCLQLIIIISYVTENTTTSNPKLETHCALMWAIDQNSNSCELVILATYSRSTGIRIRYEGPVFISAKFILTLSWDLG